MEVPGWGVETNAAAPPPASPPKTSGKPVPVVLAPHGTTKLRIGELPVCSE